MDEMGHTDPALALRVYRQSMRRGEDEKAALVPLSKVWKRHDAGHRWTAPMGQSPSPVGAVSEGNGIIEPCLRTECGDGVSPRTC